MNNNYNRKFLKISQFCQKVWCGFIGSTVLFIIVTSAFIKIKEKYGYNNEKSHTINKSFRETVSSQIVYVLTILFNQGKNKKNY